MLIAFFERRSRLVLALALVAATAGSIAIGLNDRDDREYCDHCGGVDESWDVASVRAVRTRPGARSDGHIAGRLYGQTSVAFVELHPFANGDRAGDVKHVAVDGDGFFDFGPMPAGAYQLVATRGGQPISAVVLARTDFDAVNEWQDGADVELVEQGCRSREILVTDIAGRPITGARIVVGGVPFWTPDAHGLARVCLIPDDPVELVAVAPGYASNRGFAYRDTDSYVHIVLADAADAPRTMAIDHGETFLAVIRGRVTCHGVLRPFTRVAYGDDATRTRADGSFVLALALGHRRDEWPPGLRVGPALDADSVLHMPRFQGGLADRVELVSCPRGE
jgi:hypothetical protein